jgi:RNA polymerase sigma-70 factor, ECF subfamily
VPHDPRPDIDPSAAALIRGKVRRFIRRAGLSPSDQEDLEQDLRLHLHRRRGALARAGAKREALLAVLVDNFLANALRHRRAARRDHRRERPLPPEDALARDPRRPAAGADPERAELRADVAGVLASLPPGSRDLARRLMDKPLAAVARDLGVPRSTLRARLRPLLARFGRAGLRGYL